ncbi:MAG TPA: hypothetical protein VMY37_13380 [Thermoguttaceae bacterium]|nr:hypothetical protein [Thermoguttaceae bacterium]
MADYIPGADGAFDSWQENFATYVLANLAALGLDALEIADMNAARAAWSTGYPAHSAAQAAAESARETKDTARQAYEAEIRPLVRQLQASPDVDNTERAAMGITVPDATPTAAVPPATRPVVTVDTAERLRHVIAFQDEATPTRKAKPQGVMGAEIWVKIGDPAPVDPSELEFLAVDSRTPYTTDFDGADGGKTAHYMLRWLNTRGEKGPWSETASATIGA